MAVAQRKPHVLTEPAEPPKKPRNDPRRLKAFAHRLNVMLSELGLPPRGRSRRIRERIGVSGTTANNWLRGESYPSFEELGRLGTQLGVDTARLLPDKAEVARMGSRATASSSAVSKRLARLIDADQVVPLTQLNTDDGEWDHTALPNAIWQQALGRSLAGF